MYICICVYQLSINRYLHTRTSICRLRAYSRCSPSLHVYRITHTHTHARTHTHTHTHTHAHTRGSRGCARAYTNQRACVRRWLGAP